MDWSKFGLMMKRLLFCAEEQRGEINDANDTTEVFQSGNAKAVRIPESFPLNGSAVEVFRRGDEIVIREIHRNLSQAFEMKRFGFMASRIKVPDDFDIMGADEIEKLFEGTA